MNSTWMERRGVGATPLAVAVVVVAAAMMMVAATDSAHAGALTLDLKNISAGQGSLTISLYDSGETFLNKPLRRMTVPASAATLQVSLGEVPAGDYAVSLYQDVNGNGKLDTKMFGIPAEPTGVSNNARGSYGPPKYEAARFTVPAEGKIIAIDLHN